MSRHSHERLVTILEKVIKNRCPQKAKLEKNTGWNPQNQGGSPSVNNGGRRVKAAVGAATASGVVGAAVALVRVSDLRYFALNPTPQNTQHGLGSCSPLRKTGWNENEI